MANKKIKAAVNGYGVIGKRVADAIKLQPDMELVGVADVVSDYRVKAAVVLGLPVYASLPEKSNEMKDAGIPIAGNLDDLLKKIDIIVDCTPKGIGAKNLELYIKAGVKAIYQGGEKHSLTGHSFVAQANYETALGLNATRVVSCNTTSTVRTLIALRNADLLKKNTRCFNKTGNRSLGIRPQWNYEYSCTRTAYSKPSGTGCSNSCTGT